MDLAIQVFGGVLPLCVIFLAHIANKSEKEYSKEISFILIAIAFLLFMLAVCVSAILSTMPPA